MSATEPVTFDNLIIAPEPGGGPGGVGETDGNGSLVLWLKGDAGVTTGGTLTWADQSGYGNDASQTIGGEPPSCP